MELGPLGHAAACARWQLPGRFHCTRANRVVRAGCIAPLLATLRLAAIGLVLVMLAQWALALWLTGPPAIALVIDHSASMGIVDRLRRCSHCSLALNERLVATGLTEPKRLNIAKIAIDAGERSAAARIG